MQTSPHFSLPVIQTVFDHVILLGLSVDAAYLLSGGRAGAGPPVGWTCTHNNTAPQAWGVMPLG